jgi:CubicO group peptidase (beta-lactamase class C family)
MRLTFSLVLATLVACGTSSPPKPKGPSKTAPSTTTAKKKVPKAEVMLALPTGWKKREDGPRMVIEGPEGKLQVVIVASGQPDLASAIASAWKQLEPPFVGVVKDVIKPPVSRAPFSSSLVAQYPLGKDRVLHQAIAHRYKTLTYALLMRGPLDAVKKRAAQLREVLGSVRPKGYTPKKLTAKDAKRLTPEQAAELTKFAEHARKTLELPGASFAVVQDGKLVVASGVGFFDVRKKKKKVTAKTHMMLGSITKSFTALLIAKLVAAGKLSWTTPATTLHKGFRLKRDEQTKAVMLQHLLCACTGVPRRDLPLLFEWEKHSPQKVLGALQKMEFLTKFGETFQYSNQLVAAAGFIVAKKLGRGRGLGRRYASLLKKHVLAPLGMKDSYLDIKRVKRKRRYAQPHSEDINGKVVAIDVKNEGFATPYAPAGALWSTAQDFSKLLIALTEKPRKKALPPDAQLLELWKPRAKAAANATYGLGWLTRRFKGTPVHGHGGGTLGFRSYFAYVPAANAAYVVLTNGSRGGPLTGLLARKIESMLFAQKDDTDKRLAFVRQRIDRQVEMAGKEYGKAVAADKLKKLVGRYDGGELGAIVIRDKKGQAVLDTGPLKMRFLPKNKGSRAEMYAIVDPPLTGIEFWVEHKDGKAELHFQPHSVHYVAKRK